MKCEIDYGLLSIWKEAVDACFKALSHSPGVIAIAARGDSKVVPPEYN
jgi:hypothetical protein